MLLTARELKKSMGVLSKLASKKRKETHTKPLTLRNLFNMMVNTVDSLQGKKDCVSRKKKEYKQKHLFFCNLHELYITFKKKSEF